MNEVETLKAAVSSLEAQLVSIYEERENSPDTQDLQSTVDSLEAQLRTFYSENEGTPFESGSAKVAIDNLETQVISLTDEKMEVEAELQAVQEKIDRMKLRTQAIGAAVLEAALFGHGNDSQKRVA